MFIFIFQLQQLMWMEAGNGGKASTSRPVEFQPISRLTVVSNMPVFVNYLLLGNYLANRGYAEDAGERCRAVWINAVV
jgi:hypothetical protein